MPAITLQEAIGLDEKTVLRSESSNNRPYSFKSKKEFDDCIEKACSETLDSLFRKVRSAWRKYINADDFHLKICAADTMFSYKQDVVGMTNYLFIVTDNDAGILCPSSLHISIATKIVDAFSLFPLGEVNSVDDDVFLVILELSFIILSVF